MKRLLAQTTKFGLISALFLSISTPVLANVNWVKIGTSFNDSTAYVDTASLRKQRNIVWYWLLQYYPKNADGVTRAQAYLSGNCTTKEIRVRILSSYDASDNQLQYANDGDVGDIYSLDPDTLGYAALKFACSR